MTSQELWAALKKRREELGLTLWQVSIEMDISSPSLGRLRAGQAGPDVRNRVEAWLEQRRPTPTRTE